MVAGFWILFVCFQVVWFIAMMTSPKLGQEREDAERIRDALQAIVDCYGIGYRDHQKLLDDLGEYIGDAKAILDEIAVRGV